MTFILNPYRFKAAAGLNVLALNPSSWFDASDTASLSLVDGRVAQASDKSGNAKHAMQPTAANQPAYSAAYARAGGKPALFAMAANHNLQTDVGVLAAWEEVYMVAGFGAGTEAVFNVASVGWGDGYSALFSGSGSNGNPRMMGQLNNGKLIQSSHFALGAYRNRNPALLGQNGAAGAPDLLPLPLSVLRFVRQSAAPLESRRCLIAQYSSSFSSSRAWNGPWCELIAFPVALAEADRNALIEHLIAKWGIVV